MNLELLDLQGLRAILPYSASRIRELYGRRVDPLPAIRTGRRGEKVLFSRAAVEKWVLRRGRRAMKATPEKEAGPESGNSPSPEQHQSPGI